MAFNKIYSSAKSYSKVVVFAMVATGFLAFKVADTKVVTERPAGEVCFKFSETIPLNSTTVVDPSNYTLFLDVDLIEGCNDGLRLCGLCFDETDFPLNNQLPDFINQINFSDFMIDKMANPDGTHSAQVTVPGTDKVVTLYFRPE